MTMSGYLAPFIATFAVVFLLTRVVRQDSAWRQRLPPLGFMLAAIVWLIGGVLQNAIVAMGLAIVFFTRAVSLGGYPSPFFGKGEHENRETP